MIATYDPDVVVVSEPGRLSAGAFSPFLKIVHPNLLILVNPHRVQFVCSNTVFVATGEKFANDVRLVNVTLCLNGSLCHLLGLYGPTVGHASRHSFWEALDHEIEKWHDSPVCVLGDFNALEREEEATGLVHAKSLVQPHLQRWRASLAVCDLWRWHGRDEGASSLTRCKPGSQNAGSRIDRGLVSRS